MSAFEMHECEDMLDGRQIHSLHLLIRDAETPVQSLRRAPDKSQLVRRIQDFIAANKVLLNCPHAHEPGQ
jgi:hypothetical protein